MYAAVYTRICMCCMSFCGNIYIHRYICIYIYICIVNMHYIYIYICTQIQTQTHTVGLRILASWGLVSHIPCMAVYQMYVWICMYVCVFVWIVVYAYVYAFKYTPAFHVYAHTRWCPYTIKCTHELCMYTRTKSFQNPCKWFFDEFMCVSVCVCMCAYIYTHLYISQEPHSLKE